VVHFINKPMPGKLPKKTARALLDIEDARVVPIVRDPGKVTEDSDAVFYFPGCGSERLFSQVGLATQAMLYEVGTQCVLPPGYPVLRLSADRGRRLRKGEQIIVKNRVLFHRPRDHAQLPRHPHRDRVVRHLPGPAREIRVRPHLPGRAAARHP
jgi:Fe-S oxidoreductase